MSIVLRKINSPVSIYDLQQFFGNSEGDLATLMYQLRGSINKWSKYKPVYGSMIDTVTGQFDPSATLDLVNDRWNSAANWFRGNNAGRGTAIHAYGWVPYKKDNDLVDVLSQYFANDDNTWNGWDYIHVEGGANSPYRLQDWAGYDASAYQPESKMSCPDEIKTSVSGVTFGPTIFQRITDSYPLTNRNYIMPQDVLKAVDPDGWRNVYLGFAIFDTQVNPNRVIVYSTDNYITINNDNVVNQEPPPQQQKLVQDKAYKVCMFYTNTLASGGFGAQRSSAKFATLPFMETVDFKVSGTDAITGLNIDKFTAVIYLSDSMTVSYKFTNNNTNNYTMHFWLWVNGSRGNEMRRVQVNSSQTVEGSFGRIITVPKPRTIEVELRANATFVRKIVAMDTDRDDPEIDPDNP